MSNNGTLDALPHLLLGESNMTFQRLFNIVLVSIMTLTSAAYAMEEKRVTNPTHYRNMDIDGLNIFYREAGNPKKPTVLLLHGFPTSSHMFRNLIPMLSDKYHVIAPDYPGYGNSSMPLVDEFDYSFDNLALVVEKFTEKLNLDSYFLYVMDYGAPVGFRLAAKYPERVEGIIVQNGNAYDEGIDNDFWEPIMAYWEDRDVVNTGLDNAFWAPIKAAFGQENLRVEDALGFLFTFDATRFQYLNGATNPELISPDNYNMDQRFLDRPGNNEIQLQLFFDYATNVPLYPEWQAYFREHQPPMLIVWGDNDVIFPAEGAYPYLNDLPDADLHIYPTGHFALEEFGTEIGRRIRKFLKQNR